MITLAPSIERIMYLAGVDRTPGLAVLSPKGFQGEIPFAQSKGFEGLQ